MENSRRRDICNIIVQRESNSKHFRSKKHLENIRQDDIIIAEWLLKAEQTPTEKKRRNFHNPKTFKQIARESFKLDDKELDKELA